MQPTAWKILQLAIGRSPNERCDDAKDASETTKDSMPDRSSEQGG